MRAALAAAPTGPGSKTRIIGAINNAATVLRGALTSALATGRATARREALQQLAATLDRAGATAITLPSSSGPAVDHAHAAAAADAIVARFCQALLVAATKGTAVKTTGAIIDGSVRRAATTEVARAMSDEHREATREIARRDPTLIKRFANMWDATLDAATCATCAEHDGEIVQLGTDYDDNDEPGDVHPNCRCISAAILLDFPLTEEEDEHPDKIAVEEDSEAA